jgi:3-isopropylmalate/(R)-2-methylmalate dehydratase small subunit
MHDMITGRAFVFGANLDTDQIYPGRYLELTDAEDVGQHAMAGVDPDFVNKFNPGDIIVGGANFGCGSSREHAVRTLKAIHVSVILAESFARIFYRNAINLGIAALICPGISQQVDTGDMLSVDPTAGRVVNQTQNLRIQAESLSDYVMQILASGGIVPFIKNTTDAASRC